MNRQEILDHMDRFPYDRGEYWIVAGGAMVLYGIREETADIDLGCSAAMGARMDADGVPWEFAADGRRHFRYGEDIEIYEEGFRGPVVEIDGLPVLSISGLIDMKRKLGREKDMRDLELIREYFERNRCFD